MTKTRSRLATYNPATTVRSLVTHNIATPARHLFSLPNWGHILTAVWAATAAIATASNTHTAQIMERQAQTLLFELRGPVAVPNDIVILAIDELSLSQEQIYRSNPQQYPYLESLQAWPWKRAAYAQAIDRLLAAGARTVALDVLLAGPSSYGSQDDQQLQKTLQRYPGRVVLATEYEEVNHRHGNITQLTYPLPLFQNAGGVPGSINFWVEPDGRIHRFGNQFLSSLIQQYPEQAGVLQELGGSVPAFADATLQAAQVPIPQKRGEQIWFHGPAGTFEQIPFWHVLDPANWNTYLQRGEYFKNKIVLIGATANTLQDFWAAPFSKTWLYPDRMAGVEVHANAIATLLSKQAIATAIPNTSAQGIVVLLGVIGAGVLLSYPKQPWLRWLLVLGLPLAWGGVSYLVFVYGQLTLPTALPITAIAGSGVSYIFVNSLLEHLKKRRLREAFINFADAPIVKELISQSDHDDLQNILQERERAIIGNKLKDRYVIVKVLGGGGFGETYIAQDTQRPGSPQCVVKRLRTSTNNVKLLQLARRLFQREAETLERLGKHDQIPQLLAYFEENQEFYLVQEFVPGYPLSRELTLGKQMPEAQVVAMLRDLLHALEFVHSQGVIHRDIKPSNIIRRQSDGKLVLIDFGAVKEIPQLAEDGSRAELQTAATVAIGTQGYMPSEQCAGSPRLNSDIYALGMTAIQALTGLPPSQLQQDPETNDILWKHRTEVSHELALVLSKMVRNYFSQRYQSAREVLEALQQMQGDRSTLLLSDFDLSQVEPDFADDTATAPFAADDDPAYSTVPWPNAFDSQADHV